jgi:site-specific DNA-cytosine methylase
VRYLSLFSGIEACTQAWHPLGWLPVAFAEIEPFPCAVLAHHYPDVPNLGSVTDITDEQIKALGPIDLVVGGSPCQDLSVAGKRAGFDGERSSLFFEQMRIFHAARRLCGARWLLWENVPGAFSSNWGADFAAVVGEMAGCEFGVPRNGWKSAGVAVGPNGLCEWRVLDAQYFGLAQRRRRVFALLDTGDWHSRQPVLLEPESLRGDSTPSREAGEVAARWPADCAPTLNAAFGSKQGLEDQHALGGAGLFVPDIVGALTAKGPEAMGAPEIDANHYVCLPPHARPNPQHGCVPAGCGRLRPKPARRDSHQRRCGRADLGRRQAWAGGIPPRCRAWQYAASLHASASGCKAFPTTSRRSPTATSLPRSARTGLATRRWGTAWPCQ